MAINSTQLRLHLSAWYDGGCEIDKFIVQYRARGQSEWILVSNNILREQQSVLIRDLSPATAYELLVGAQNQVGQTEAKYRLNTLDADGKPVPMSHSFLGVAGSSSAALDDDHMVVDYIDESGTRREVWPSRDLDPSGQHLTSANKWLYLIGQLLNSPLTLLLALCLFIVLLALLIFNRFATPQTGSSSSSSSSNKSSLGTTGGNGGSGGGGGGGGGARHCSLFGQTTTLDGTEPALSSANGCDDGSPPLDESPARVNLAGSRGDYAALDCYSATSYCPAAGHQLETFTGPSEPQSNSTECSSGYASNCQQQQQNYYAPPAAYATVHRSATMDPTSLAGAEQRQQQQCLMQMLMMAQPNQPDQVESNYSMAAAAALNSMARHKAATLKPSNNYADSTLVCPNMTLGRQMVDLQRMQQLKPGKQIMESVSGPQTNGDQANQKLDGYRQSSGPSMTTSASRGLSQGDLAFEPTWLIDCGSSCGTSTSGLAWSATSNRYSEPMPGTTHLELKLLQNSSRTPCDLPTSNAQNDNNKNCDDEPKSPYDVPSGLKTCLKQNATTKLSS